MHSCHAPQSVKAKRQPDHGNLMPAVFRWSWTSACSDCTALVPQMLTQPQMRLLRTKSGTCQLQSSMAYGPALYMTPISRPACWLTPLLLCSSATGKRYPACHGSQSGPTRSIYQGHNDMSILCYSEQQTSCGNDHADLHSWTAIMTSAQC